jgi:hypothetical protein
MNCNEVMDVEEPAGSHTAVDKSGGCVQELLVDGPPIWELAIITRKGRSDPSRCFVVVEPVKCCQTQSLHGVLQRPTVPGLQSSWRV